MGIKLGVPAYSQQKIELENGQKLYLQDIEVASRSKLFLSISTTEILTYLPYDDVTWKRLESKLEYAGECWFWNGTNSSNGYPTFTLYGKALAVKKALAVYYGLGWIRYSTTSCGQIECVNPEHIQLGRAAKEYKDVAKLSTYHIKDIKERLTSGEPGAAIAKIYNVNHSIISRIKAGRYDDKDDRFNSIYDMECAQRDAEVLRSVHYLGKKKLNRIAQCAKL